MQKYLWPISAMMAAVLAGVALMVSPFAMHLNRAGGAWSHATEAMFWSGLFMVVLGMASGGLWQRDLANQVRTAEARIHPVPERPEPTADDTTAETAVEDNWDRELAKLAEAVLEDLRAETVRTGGNYRAEELEKVASALLRDLPEQKSSRTESGRGGGFA